jgi:3-oxoadipate enol-lactonase
MPFAAVGDQSIHYVRDGDGPAVVFSHGFLMDHEMFAPQVAALKDDWTCVRWDQRYHGQTGSDQQPFSIADAVGDLLGLLDHLGIDRAVHVGFSFGGWIAARLALAAPERVSGLVIVDSYERMEGEEERTAYRGFQQMVTGRGFDEEVTGIMRGFLFGADHDPSYWVGKWRFRAPQDWGFVYDAMLSRDDINPRLSEITCPSLVLHSEHNPANPPEVSQAYADALGNCDGMHVISGSGHTAPLERPDEVNELLRGFLQRHA